MVDQALITREHVVVCGDVNANLLDSSDPQSMLLTDFTTLHDLLPFAY